MRRFLFLIALTLALAGCTPWAGQAVKRDFAKDVLPALLAVQGRILAYRSIEYTAGVIIDLLRKRGGDQP